MGFCYLVSWFVILFSMCIVAVVVTVDARSLSSLDADSAVIVITKCKQGVLSLDTMPLRKQLQVHTIYRLFRTDHHLVIIYWHCHLDCCCRCRFCCCCCWCCCCCCLNCVGTHPQCRWCLGFCCWWCYQFRWFPQEVYPYLAAIHSLGVPAAGQHAQPRHAAGTNSDSDRDSRVGPHDTKPITNAHIHTFTHIHIYTNSVYPYSLSSCCYSYCCFALMVWTVCCCWYWHWHWRLHFIVLQRKC